jgi:pyrroline-5-carboxylate reductase
VLDGAATVLAQGFDPAAARAAVTSKGGTTAAGLSVMDEDDAIDTLMYHTLQAAAERAGGLAQALRTPDTSEEGSA